ncbi:MAG: (Fe-S)-binding protein [Firmicutes bacterium]|nr:(Fe-S)-binding protein [Bacillota bacterium]
MNSFNLKKYKSEISKCVKCGTCTSICPVYRETLQESVSARGKMSLIEAFLEGEIGASSILDKRLRQCVQCTKCIEECPNGIPVDIILFSAWRALKEKLPTPLWKNFAFEKALSGAGIPAAAGFLYRNFGGLSAILPVEALKRKVSRRKPLKFKTTKLNSGKKIGFYPGCMIDSMYPEILSYVREIFARLGYEMIIPSRLVCCGLPQMSTGNVELARRNALVNMNAFKDAKVDVIITACATCLSTVRKKYPLLLEDTPALKVYEKFMDLSEFLAGEKGLENFPEAEGKFTYHDPCHLARELKIKEEPREIIKKISAGNFAEADSSELCCGFGGSFNFENYSLSMNICSHLVKALKDTGAETVITSCPACMWQIEDGISRSNSGMNVMHLAEFVLRGALNADTDKR